VVDVADRADVHVRLGALELLLGHVTVLTPSSGAAGPQGLACREEPAGVEPTIGLEPMTSSLPRKCSAG
jgi:hypothetical protein